MSKNVLRVSRRQSSTTRMPLTRLQKCSGSARRALFAQIARRARRAAGACTRRLELSFCFQYPLGKCQQLLVGNLTLLIGSCRLVPTLRVCDCWPYLLCSQSEQSGSFHQDVWRRVVALMCGDVEAGEGAQIRRIKGDVGACPKAVFYSLRVSQKDTCEPAASACSQVGFLRAQRVVFFSFMRHSPSLRSGSETVQRCSKWCAIDRRYLRECGRRNQLRHMRCRIAAIHDASVECCRYVVERLRSGTAKA